MVEGEGGEGGDEARGWLRATQIADVEVLPPTPALTSVLVTVGIRACWLGLWLYTCMYPGTPHNLPD